MLEHWAAVLGAIVDAPRAWSTVAELADATECTEYHISETLNDLALNGMASAWSPRPEVEGWTLTPLSAEGLKVSLCEYGMSGRARWRRRDEPARRPKVGRVGPRLDPALVIDPGPGPEAAATAADESSRWRPKGPLRVEQLPRPTVILTGSKSTWDEAPGHVANRKRPPKKTCSQPHKFKCSSCLGARLKPNVYCARCHRWGLDGLVAAHRRAEAEAARAREAG